MLGSTVFSGRRGIVAMKTYKASRPPDVAVNSTTGSATLTFETDQGAIEISVEARDFFNLVERAIKQHAQARPSGLSILPTAARYLGLVDDPTPPQIHLASEDGSEFRLPIEESALKRLSTDLTERFPENDQDEDE
jgi:hypothetical protein